MDKQKILIVDHEPLVISTLVEFLKDEPYENIHCGKWTKKP